MPMHATILTLFSALAAGPGAPRERQSVIDIYRGEQATIRGSLVGLETVRFQGEPRVIVKVRTGYGDTAILDLGPLQDIYSRATRISATGTPGRVDGQFLLIVDRLETDDGSIVFHGGGVNDRSSRAWPRPAPGYRRSDESARPSAAVVRDPGRESDATRIVGQVIALRTTGPQFGERRVLAEIETAAGEVAIVDLGEGSTLSRSRRPILPGQYVAITGTFDANSRLMLMHEYQIIDQRLGQRRR